MSTPEFGEPWSVRESWHQCPFEQENGRAISMLPSINNRIVACVNAMAGHDPTSVVVVPREVVEEVKALLEAISKAAVRQGGGCGSLGHAAHTISGEQVMKAAAMFLKLNAIQP
jgi:hypothetical protein